MGLCKANEKGPGLAPRAQPPTSGRRLRPSVRSAAEARPGLRSRSNPLGSCGKLLGARALETDRHSPYVECVGGSRGRAPSIAFSTEGEVYLTSHTISV